MRGKVMVDKVIDVLVGITPAHAGKSFILRGHGMCGRDHPRPCGEKAGIIASYKISIGSPPPMRGKAHLRSDRTPHTRITPAHAGKSSFALAISVLYRDHPRPCGEKTARGSGKRSTSGSPPPMRGKVVSYMWCAMSFRITPAHAGKSTLMPLLYHFARDHPRPCGEKLAVIVFASPVRGSPPPMRGKAICKIMRYTRVRITPAHAGKR